MSDEEELRTAVKADDAGKVRGALDRSPFLVRTPTPEGTFVLTAVYHGAGEALKVLLERTPEDALNLYEASATGNPRRLKTILGQSRARVNDPNPEGFSPLGLASFFGHPDAVKVLLGNGADVNLRPPSRFQNTALDAAVAGDHTEVVRILLNAGGDPNVRSEANYTSLHKAALHGNVEIVRMLLEHGADPTAVRDGGHTPLDDAREKGHDAVVAVLADRGSRPQPP